MKLLIIVPYRDRESHLKEFIPYITTTLQTQQINNKIVIIEQNSRELFNRGLLCNIGFELYKNEYDYICIHDIDMIGEDFDYSYEPIVTHLSALSKARNYEEWYDDYLGGVVLFPNNIFLKINGFSNQYWGWGCEDDDISIRCKTMECKIQRKQCKYYTLDHDTMLYHKRLDHSPGFKENMERFKFFRGSKNKKSIIINDGLSTINNFYSIDSILDMEYYTLVKTIVKKS